MSKKNKEIREILAGVGDYVDLVESMLPADVNLKEAVNFDGGKGGDVYKIHIPMLISSDVDRTIAVKMSEAQQIKVVGEITAILKRGQFNPELFTEASMPLVSLGAKYFKSKESLAKQHDIDNNVMQLGGIDVEDKKKKSILYTTPYSVIDINIRKRLFFVRKVRIMVRVYSVVVSPNDILDVMKSRTRKVSSQEVQRNLRSVVGSAIGSKIANTAGFILGRSIKTLGSTNNKIANIINKEMASQRAWGSSLQKSKFGLSIMFSEAVVTEFGYSGFDMRSPEVIRNLLAKFSVYDFIIAGDDYFDILNHLSLEFDRVSSKELALKLPKEKVSISFD